MSEVGNLTGFPEGVYPARFRERIDALVKEIDAELTEEELAACQAAYKWQVGPYQASIVVHDKTGNPVTVSFGHTDLRRVELMREKLVELVEGGAHEEG